MKKPIFSKSFKERRNDLQALKRYGRFDVMLYRTNLGIHITRVGAIVEKLLPFTSIYQDFSSKKALLISEHHDDYELILEGGDIPLQLKLMMDVEEKENLKMKEVLAAERIAEFYPKSVKGHRYLDLLLHAIHKDCKEAQLYSFADKLDGYCEAVHEVLAGNTVFLDAVINYHAKTFNQPEKNFPLIHELFNGQGGGLFHFPVVDLTHYFEKGKRSPVPHTVETIRRETVMPHYEAWKKITLSIFPNGMDLLTKQVEFHQT